jgi:hypothetical protein
MEAELPHPVGTIASEPKPEIIITIFGKIVNSESGPGAALRAGFRRHYDSFRAGISDIARDKSLHAKQGNRYERR